MTRIGCRAHDYGKLPAAALAATLRAKGYNAAQLAMPRAIAGIEDFAHITDKQLALVLHFIEDPDGYWLEIVPTRK